MSLIGYTSKATLILGAISTAIQTSLRSWKVYVFIDVCIKNINEYRLQDSPVHVKLCCSVHSPSNKLLIV